MFFGDNLKRELDQIRTALGDAHSDSSAETDIV